MEHSNPLLIELLIKKLKDLVCDSDIEKTKVLSQSISSYLQKSMELKNYINENKTEIESKIFFELGKYLKYYKYQKGQFITHSYEDDNFFYMIFSGDVAKIDIKYKRIYLSFKEYLVHLIKLRLLQENAIYFKCIKKNKNIFPFDEKMDILTTTDINIDHYPELVKSIKKEIINSSWYSSTNPSNDIRDFLKLYNYKIATKNNFVEKETKYPAYIPFYVFDKILTPISFVGHLTKPKKIKWMSSYVCLNPSDVFYLDKKEINEKNNLFIYFQRRVSENVIKQLFEGHFLFKDADRSFLIKNYSKYFYLRKCFKGEKLIQQNCPHEGLFFINSGIFQLSTVRSYNDLDDLYYNLLHALDNYAKVKKIEKNNTENNKNIFEGLNQKQIQKFIELKNISFNKYIAPDVMGLNDIFDIKTGLYNYSVECFSKEAEVYFVPNEIVASLLTNDNIKAKFGEIIEKKCMTLINEIKKYKLSFQNSIQLEMSHTKENNKNISSYSSNMSKMARLNTNQSIKLKYNTFNRPKLNLNIDINSARNKINNNMQCLTTLSSANGRNDSLNIVSKSTQLEKLPQLCFSQRKSGKIKLKLNSHLLRPNFDDKKYKTSFRNFKIMKKIMK